jgi:penicillin G amidase
MNRRALPALLLVVLAACQSEATPTGTPIETTVSGVPGLGSEVQVTYDGLGVPHVSAASDDDASYALGYVHARDRLFQMDFLRRAARGTLAELLGPAALGNDVTIRTLFTAQEPVPPGKPNAGSYRIEDVIFATLTPGFQAYLQRYADGVNRYLQDLATLQNGARYPVEYAALDSALTGAYAPTPWTVQDTLAVARLLTFQLSFGGSEEITFGQFAQAFAAACGANPLSSCAQWGLFNDLTRYAPAAGTFVLSPAAAPAALAAPASGAARAPSGRSAIRQSLESIRRLHGLPAGEPAGSNNWVLAAPLTAHATVANDPHLSLSNPSNFYLQQVTTSTRNVGGVAFPGAPVIEIGHNDHVGWGATVAEYDVTDVYYFPDTGGGPLLPPGVTPVPLAESFRARGSTAVVTQPVLLIPGYGPVVEHSGGLYFTIRWTGQEPSNEALAFFQLNGAKSVDEAFTAVKTFQVGAQNFVFADVNGNIGYYPHAYVPTRGAAVTSGNPLCYGVRSVGGTPTQVVPWAPMPGFDGLCAWTGRISDEALPQAKNPATHRIVTANNDITGVTAGNDPLSAWKTGGDYLFAYTDLGYRAARATALLSAKSSGYTLGDMTATQADNYSLFAADVVPGLLQWLALPSVQGQVQALGLAPAIDVLAHWASASNPRRFTTPTGLASSDPAGAKSSDAEVVAASNAAMLFHALVPRLAARVLDPLLSTVDFEGAPMTTQVFLAGPGGQEAAKYLAALATLARGATPAVPLYTGLAPCGGTPDSCALVAVAALDDTVKFLSTQAFASAVPADWIWGRKHRATFDSPLSSAGVTLFDYGLFANDGGLYTVDVANFGWNDAGANGFVQRAGANVRFSAEMIAAGNVKWRAVIPGGAPDFAADPNYENQVPLWLTNAAGDQPWTAAEVLAAAKTRIVFTP